MRSFCTLAVTLVLASTTWLPAQDVVEETPPPPAPVAVLNFASLDRLLADAAYVFEAAGRPELMEWLADGLAVLQDLEGIDRTKPMGAMLFLAEGLPPRPVPVAYIPVEDGQKLLNTLSMNETLWKKSGTVEGRYATVGGPELHLEFRGDYAYLVRQEESFLDRELPEPITYNAPLTERYDAAAAIRIYTVPDAIRKVFVGFLRANSEVELQQRDGEAETAYRIRRAQGMSLIEFIDQLLTEGDQVTLGWDASAEARRGVLELSIDAKANSEFARFLTDVSGQKSSFHAMFDEDQPLCLSASWELPPRDREAYAEVASALRDQVELDLLEKDLPGDSVPGLFDAIDATIQSGHMDFCMQFAAPEEGRFVLLGGVRIVGARTFGESLARLLNALRDDPDVAAIELNVDSHEGIAFHRLKGKDASAQDQRTFGGAPSLYVGCSDRALWFAIGTQGSTAYLKPVIDAVQRAESEPPATTNNAPFQLIARISQWMQIPGPDRGDKGPSWRRQLVDEAFSGEDDALRIDVRPTETGGRIRIQFDEAFLRFIALRVGREYDRSQL